MRLRNILLIIIISLYSILLYATSIQTATGPTEATMLQDNCKILLKEIIKAEKSGSIDRLRETTIAFSNIATSCGYEDILAWKWNNLGYELIKTFIMDTAYIERIQIIDSAKLVGTEKLNYIKETKKIFKEKLYLLQEAQEYLEKAKKLDDSLTKKNASRTKKIKNNLDFIKWILNFINKEK